MKPAGATRLAPLLVMSTLVLALLGSSVPSPLYGVYQERWHFPATVLTAIYTAYSVGTLMALLVLGWLSDRLGDRRRLLLIGLGCVFAGAVVMAFAQSVGVLLIGRVFAGLGTGAVAGPATAALVELDPLRDGKKAAITATAAVTVGATLGPIVSGAALATHAAPTLIPFVLLAVLSLGSGLALGLLRWPAATPLPHATSAAASTSGGFGALLMEAGLPFAIACFGMALAWMVGGTFVALGPSFAHRLVGIDSKALAGLTVSAFQIAAGITQIFTRRLSSRQALVGGAVMMSASLCLCALAAAWGSAALFCVATLLTGGGYGACFAGAAGLASRSAPARGRSALVSLSYAAGYVGNLVPVIAIGMVIDHFGLLTALAAGAATALILALLLALACLRIAAR